MKLTYLTVVFCLLVTAAAVPQKRMRHNREIREKMAQLERIKLIEILEMDEETTLRFFSRRAEFQKRQDDIRDEIDSTISELETTLKSTRMITDTGLQSMINRVNELHLEMEKMKVDFLNSLKDILTYDQIARLVVFEKRFREELRRVLLHGPRSEISP